MHSLSLVFTNLRRHRLRALIGVAGIAFGVAAMLTILGIVNGAIGMFERILSSDSHYLVFERNVSDLFFSSVPETDAQDIRALPHVASAHPLLFGVVSSPGFPVITCFGLEAEDPRLTHAKWLEGSRERFGASEGEIFLGARRKLLVLRHSHLPWFLQDEKPNSLLRLESKSISDPIIRAHQ